MVAGLWYCDKFWTYEAISGIQFQGNPDLERVALIGIHTRGVPIAHRLRRLIDEFSGVLVASGSLDITFYRDDVQV